MNAGTNNVYTVSPTSFSSSFTVNYASCPVTTYSIAKLVGTTYQAYSGTLVSVDASNNLLVSTSEAIEATLYLKGETELGSSPAYLKLTIAIGESELSNSLNLPPILDPEPEQIKVVLATADEVISKEVVFPEPQDQTGSVASFTMTGLEAFMTFDEATRTLTLTDVTKELAGIYNPEIVLEDT